MTRTASDVLVDTLIDWGVDHVFGLPGDGINGLMEALRIRQDRIRFVQVRHEEAAAFAACAWAKWTGRLGCCLATTGPGGIHLLTGLYDAKLDRAPVIAITGLPYSDLAQTGTQQDVDHVRLFADVAEIATPVFRASHVENVVSLACRTALARRGVAHVAIPADVQEEPADDAPRSPRNVAGHVGGPWTEAVRDPARDALDRAVEVLDAGLRIAILAGQGARGAGETLLELAERLGAPVAKALLGKDVVPDDHPLVTGGVGYLGARPSQQMFAECDTLLIVGSTFPYIEYYPQPGQVRAVQIDVDAARIGLRHPIEAPLVGDAGACLHALIGRVRRHEDRGFAESIAARKTEWLDALARGAAEPGDPIKPQRVVHALDARLSSGAVVVADCGHNTGLAAQYLTIRAGMRFGVSGTLASMGCAIPYAIAASLAYPDRQVVAVVGDGGLSMSLGDLVTCVRHRLPVKVVVIDNGSLGQIKWEQMMFLGHPEFGCDLTPIDFAAVARGMGWHGTRVERTEDLDAALDAALAHDGPALVDVVVDPAEPMLPPKRRETYVANMRRALDLGTPGREAIERRMAQEPARTSLGD